MWKEYVNPASKHAKQNYLDFVGCFPAVEKIHTSGHASAECLVEVCNTVNPSLGIIPIHSEKSASYANLPIGEGLLQKIITSSTTLADVRIVITPKA
jgi:ribonuclease J